MESMSRSPIPLSYVILAAIGEQGASTPELIDMFGRGGMYWTASPSQIYAEPQRLRMLGWITSEKAPGKTRSRTVYRLTPKGRKALRQWLRRPVGFPRLQHEASIHLFAGDLLNDDEIVASLRKLREDIRAMSAAVDANIARAPMIPHRTRYLLLQQDLGRRLLQAHADWLDEVERELGPDSPRRAHSGRRRSTVARRRR
jgi:PadR family transcriptional regulator, regulatory protein AphA